MAPEDSIAVAMRIFFVDEPGLRSVSSSIAPISLFVIDCIAR